MTCETSGVYETCELCEGLVTCETFRVFGAVRSCRTVELVEQAEDPGGPQGSLQAGLLVG